MIRTGFIGSVELSKIALQTIVDFGIEINIVFSLDESASDGVSDYFPLHDYAIQKKIKYKKFNKITDVADDIKEEHLDYLFVIGLSQLIPENILSSVSKYCIGFHPTSLPKYRGRAPIPWMILLGVREPMITFFKLDKGIDSGDIIFQEPYFIENSDYVNDVYLKVENAIKSGLKKCLPNIYSENVNFIKQDNNIATYLLKRRPSDGEIKWTTMGGQEILDLIRAVSYPYPGAYANYNGDKVIIDKASLIPNNQYYGLSGQIAKIESGAIYVLTKDNYLLILEKYVSKTNKQMKFSVGGRFN